MTDPRKIIAELVALEDERVRLRQLHEMGHGTDYDHYHKALPKAWAAARAFLAEPEAKPVVVEHAALHELVLWAYSKLHAREFTRLEDALELDRMKLYVEHRVIA